MSNNNLNVALKKVPTVMIPSERARMHYKNLIKIIDHEDTHIAYGMIDQPLLIQMSTLLELKDIYMLDINTRGTVIESISAKGLTTTSANPSIRGLSDVDSQLRQCMKELHMTPKSRKDFEIDEDADLNDNAKALAKKITQLQAKGGGK